MVLGGARVTSNRESLPVHLTLSDLQVLLGGVHEALFELGDDEFHVRVGVTADNARVLMQQLLEVRTALKELTSDG